MTYIITTKICGHNYYLQDIGTWPKYLWNGLKDNARQFPNIRSANEVRRIWESHSKTYPLIQPLS